MQVEHIYLSTARSATAHTEYRMNISLYQWKMNTDYRIIIGQQTVCEIGQGSTHPEKCALI